MNKKTNIKRTQKESVVVNEEQIKAICKFLVEYGNRNLNDVEKELLKQAVDQSHNWQELFLTMMMASKH